MKDARVGGEPHLGYSWHLVCPPQEIDAHIVLLLCSLVGEAELGIGCDDCNLAQVLQDLGAIVLPVAQYCDRQLGSLEALAVALFADKMHIGFIPAVGTWCKNCTKSSSDLHRLDSGCTVEHPNPMSMTIM